MLLSKEIWLQINYTGGDGVAASCMSYTNLRDFLFSVHSCGLQLNLATSEKHALRCCTKGGWTVTSVGLLLRSLFALIRCDLWSLSPEVSRLICCGQIRGSVEHSGFLPAEWPNIQKLILVPK